MSRHLLKYALVEDFESEQGEGSKVVTSVTPGVAYIQENGETCYNDTVPEPTPNVPEEETDPRE